MNMGAVIIIGIFVFAYIAAECQQAEIDRKKYKIVKQSQFHH